MKRIMLVLLGSFLLTGISLPSQAIIKLFGLEVNVEKGTKEWNADKTDTKCVGKGLCTISIKGNGGLLSTSGTPGTLGFTEDGRFALSLSSLYITKEAWGDTFVDGTVTIYKDLDLRSLQSQLRGCPASIPAGTYRYVTTGDQIVVYFN